MSIQDSHRQLSFQKTFAALKHRNYRLWFWGQMVSLFGTWMQMTAQGFLIYQLTQSSAYLGYVGFASGVPSWLLMMYGGVVADRMPRRTLLLITQSSMMMLAFILAALTGLGIVVPWHILILAVGLGIANAFDAPARLAFVSEMVAPEDLTNAVALNGAMFNTATAIGPAVAGVTYAVFGPAWCFMINGVSFLAVIAALIAMQIEQQTPAHKRTSTLSSLMEGLHFVRHQQSIRALIALVATTSLFGMSLGTLLPAWSVKILHGDATTNGLLFSSRGIGSLFGALLIASIGHATYRGRFIVWGALVFPIFITIFAFVSWLPLSLVLMALLGIASIMVVNLSNASIQSLVPDTLRGRVMGVYSTIFMGSMPLGALILGTIAEHAGEAEAALVSAAIAFSIALFIWFKIPAVRLLK